MTNVSFSISKFSILEFSTKTSIFCMRRLVIDDILYIIYFTLQILERFLTTFHRLQFNEIFAAAVVSKRVIMSVCNVASLKCLVGYEAAGLRPLLSGRAHCIPHRGPATPVPRQLLGIHRRGLLSPAAGTWRRTPAQQRKESSLTWSSFRVFHCNPGLLITSLNEKVQSNKLEPGSWVLGRVTETWPAQDPGLEWNERATEERRWSMFYCL